MIVPAAIETMSDTPSDLAHLRRRIDEIDDRLQDLLIERIGFVSRIAALKLDDGGVAAHQPAREAEIIRRLISRNHRAFPPAALVRMWRELLGATTRTQGPFMIAVYAPPETLGYWDLARDHYGSLTTMTAYPSTAQVIRAVTDKRAAIGVLPMPQEGDVDPWWRHPLLALDAAPRVITRLPFGSPGNARSDGTAALAIGHSEREATGDDRTLIVTENTLHISHDSIKKTLLALGLECTLPAWCEQAGGANTLIELDGFIELTDPRIEDFRAQLGEDLQRIIPLGGYAVPLSAAELSTPPLPNSTQLVGTAATAAARG